MEKIELIGLNSYEMMSIDGGRSVSYHLGRITGFVTGTFISLVAGFKDGITGSEHE